jgi:ubiquinone/menaquinone biosynthesis C-methylase UbiE
MNWKVKCVSSYILSKLPQSMRIYNAIQKHLTGRWHRDVRHTMAVPNNYTMHIDAFHKYWGDFKSAQYYEFGVARDLFSNLVNYCSGIEKQLAIDLNPLATAELVNGTCSQLREVTSPYIVRKPTQNIGNDFKRDLLENYGIDYRAPSDARAVKFPDGSVDLIASTSTFEHIPEEMLRKILAECHRLCHKGSIMSHEIDYSDHYSHRDNSITPYNFLKFSDKTWDRIHMRHYYQNRLRHNEIRRLIIDSGFTILEESTVIPENAKDMISTVQLAQNFRTFPMADLLATKGHFICTK